MKTCVYHGKAGARWFILGLVAFFVYGAGVFQILNPATRAFSLRLTPIALLVSTAVLFLFARFPWNFKNAGILFFIFLAGYIAEVAGVNTGIIFGSYSYGSNFGIKLWDTPLLIGVNWVFLVYACAAVAFYFPWSGAVQVGIAVLLMLGYDVILEKAAPLMGLWEWKEARVPFYNYLSWFVLAVFFQGLLRKYRVCSRNAAALPLLLLQIGLFVAIISGGKE